MRLSWILLLAVACYGCRPSSPANDPDGNADATRDRHGSSVSATPPWVGRVWINSDPTERPGVMRIFLADGTLVMDSCWETYRLASWQAVTDSVVVWQEDTAEIRAHLELGAERLQMRLILGRDTLVEQYHVASVPYVCPEMMR